MQYSSFRQDSIPLHAQNRDETLGDDGKNVNKDSYERLLQLTVPENERLKPVVYAGEPRTYV
jgi:hypothetical protein